MEKLTKSLPEYDALCILEPLSSLKSHLESAKTWDKSFEDHVSVFKSDAFDCRVIYSPISIGDYDDVRKYSEAGKKALEMAIQVIFALKK